MDTVEHGIPKRRSYGSMSLQAAVGRRRRRGRSAPRPWGGRHQVEEKVRQGEPEYERVYPGDARSLQDAQAAVGVAAEDQGEKRKDRVENDLQGAAIIQAWRGEAREVAEARNLLRGNADAALLHDFAHDGRRLPALAQARDEPLDLRHRHRDEQAPARLRVVEWQQAVGRNAVRDDLLAEVLQVILQAAGVAAVRGKRFGLLP